MPTTGGADPPPPDAAVAASVLMATEDTRTIIKRPTIALLMIRVHGIQRQANPIQETKGLTKRRVWHSGNSGRVENPEQSYRRPQAVASY